MLAAHVDTNSSPGCSASNTPLATVSEKVVEDNPSTPMGDLDETSASWFRPSQVLAIIAIWGVNQMFKCMEYLFLSLNCDFQISTCFLK